jgi:hypothetical protein
MSSPRDRLGFLLVTTGSVIAGMFVANLSACYCGTGWGDWEPPEPADRSFIVDDADQFDLEGNEVPASDLLGARVDTFADGRLHLHYTSATGYDWTARFRPIIEDEDEPRPGCY